MSDLLTQDEINALIEQLNSGGSDDVPLASTTAEKKVTKYDFVNPTKFNREQLKTLSNIYEDYARSLSSFLTGFLRTSSTLEVTNVEGIQYRDFSAALSNPVIMAMVNVSPLKGSIILEISNNIGYAIIDRILGGPGFGIKKMREFSEVEKILLERVILQMINYLPEPWANFMAFKPRLEKIETNASFAQMIAPNDFIALVILGVKIGSSEGKISFCLPHLVLEPIMDRLYTQYAYKNQKDQDDNEVYREKLSEELEKTKVPVSAMIGRTNIMVSDFVGLQVGDIISLDNYVDSDLTIKVGHMNKFQAKAGTNRGRYAVQITALIEREDSK